MDEFRRRATNRTIAHRDGQDGARRLADSLAERDTAQLPVTTEDAA